MDGWQSFAHPQLNSAWMSPDGGANRGTVTRPEKILARTASMAALSNKSDIFSASKDGFMSGAENFAAGRVGNANLTTFALAWFGWLAIATISRSSSAGVR